LQKVGVEDNIETYLKGTALESVDRCNRD